MATITKRMTKSGPTYRIQVKLKDKGSGKTNVYSTTWKPQMGMTPKQMEREVIVYADQYENNLRMSLTAAGGDGVSPDTTLADYMKWWLERRKEELSVSYYVNCQSAITEIAASIGGYKLRELNPTIIQRFYDDLDRRERIIITVCAKPEFQEAVDAARRGERKLKQKLDYDSGPLLAALRGDNIRLEQAEKIAENFGCRTTALFNVKKKKQPYAYETMHKIKRTLRAILSHAKKQRLIVDNYATADYIDFPKRPSKEIDYMNDEDAKLFYATALAYPDVRCKTAALILLLTGIRRGELCGLEWSNVDLKEGTITIERSVTTVKGVGLVEKDPKTESSKRVISISDKLVAVLMEYKEWYDQYKYDVGDRWHETNRLFISEDGKVMYPGTISYWVHKICDQAGLPHRTVHSLRHTNITMQIAAGVPLVTVAGRAGHARTSTTTDIYSHFLKSSDRTAAEKIEELFD